MKKIKVTGLKNIQKNLRLNELQVRKRTAKGLRHGAEEIKQESIARTPLDTGRLIDSAYGGKGAPVMETSSGAMWTKVGYDDTIAPYAMAVHESPGTLKGKPRRNGNGNYWDLTGQPHFLHNAVMEKLPRLKES